MAAEKSQALFGFYELGMELIERGAIVRFLRLPEVGGVKVGVDDWLIREGSGWETSWPHLEEIALDEARLVTLAAWHQRRRAKQMRGPMMYPGPRHLTDVGNAERFVHDHRTRARFCYELKSWFIWDDRRWRADTKGHVLTLAKQTVSTIFDLAKEESDDTKRKALAKWAAESETERRLTSFLRLAHPDLAIEAACLDADPWMLNCRNGTLDLRTGFLRPGTAGRFHHETRPGGV